MDNMNRKDRLFLLVTFCLIGLMITADLVTDFGEGVALWHVLVEGGAGILALCGVVYTLKSMFAIKADLAKERDSSATFKREAERWQAQSRAHLRGLSAMIDAQLTQWNLTPAEKEVAFLLLKGLSLIEVAALRGTSEKTARVQSASIYAKAGLKNRSELSAFFLEDLLPSSLPAGQDH